MDQELLYLSSKLQHECLIRYHSMSIEEKNGTLYVRVGLYKQEYEFLRSNNNLPRGFTIFL